VLHPDKGRRQAATRETLAYRAGGQDIYAGAAIFGGAGDAVKARFREGIEVGAWHQGRRVGLHCGREQQALSYLFGCLDCWVGHGGRVTSRESNK
jgi:hypothetical protein